MSCGIKLGHHPASSSFIRPFAFLQPLLAHRLQIKRKMPITILDLPIEIIDSITACLAASPLPQHLLPRNRPPCACRPAHPTVYDEDDEDDEDNREYRDASLDLSMVCREMRGVVFEKTGRAVNAGLCKAGLERNAGIPSRVRDTVR